MESYDYENRTGVRTLDWAEFSRLAARLAEQVAPFEPDVIVSIAKAGLIPATAVACALRCDLVPVRISRRLDDVVVHQTPQWRVPLTAGLAGKRVVVIDEIADTGQTLSMVVAHTRENGAPHVLSASLVSHTWAEPRPDLAVLVTDELVVFPWDLRVKDGAGWALHPEIAEAVQKLQSHDPRTAAGRPSGLEGLSED